MPELHRLTPVLGILQDRGHRVALVTDGRMSGASGKVPAAIHVTPETTAGGPLARVRDGDIVRLDAEQGALDLAVTDQEWQSRQRASTAAESALNRPPVGDVNCSACFGRMPPRQSRGRQCWKCRAAHTGRSWLRVKGGLSAFEHV